MQNPNWRKEEYGFFGDFYIQGDNSLEGYLVENKQSLSERTMTEANGIIKLLGLQEGAKILDCPCGYGRHSLYLSKRLFDVVGIDVNKRHLFVAKKEADKQKVNCNFEHKNMLDLEYSYKFDAIINMFYSFGFFESDEENIKVLENFYKSLKKGGMFLMHTDVNIPFIEKGKYKHIEKRKLTNGKTLKIIDNYSHETKRIEGAWIIKDKNGTEVKKEYSVRVYSKEEFIEICKKVGFKSCKAYSNRGGSEYSEDYDDMIIVATK